MSNKKFEIESITLPAMGLILVIGAAIFLFTKTNAYGVHRFKELVQF